MSNIFNFAFRDKKPIIFIVLLILFALPRLGFSQNKNQPVFNHAALCAKNLKKTAAFYTTVLQLKQIPTPFKDTLHAWFMIGPGLALHIIQGECPITGFDSAHHLCFSVPSLEVFIKHLEKLNLSFVNFGGEEKKIQLRPDGVHQIYFKDPDGYWIEINDAK
jgi:lactoylglutathione lyase